MSVVAGTLIVMLSAAVGALTTLVALAWGFWKFWRNT